MRYIDEMKYEMTFGSDRPLSIYPVCCLNFVRAGYPFFVLVCLATRRRAPFEGSNIAEGYRALTDTKHKEKLLQRCLR